MLEPTIDMLPSETLYTNGYTTIPGAPDHHLLFPVVWNASLNDNTRVVMATSHNGKVWHWVPGLTLLETQPFGHWAGGAIWVATDLIELPNGDWAMRCSGHNVPHKYPRGQRKGASSYATWAQGWMMGVEATNRGQFTTVAFMPPGRTLRINAVTRRTGGIRIEADRWGWSEEGRPYPYKLTPLQRLPATTSATEVIDYEITAKSTIARPPTCLRNPIAARRPIPRASSCPNGMGRCHRQIPLFLPDNRG